MLQPAELSVSPRIDGLIRISIAGGNATILVIIDGVALTEYASRCWGITQLSADQQQRMVESNRPSLAVIIDQKLEVEDYQVDCRFGSNMKKVLVSLQDLFDGPPLSALPLMAHA